MATHRCWDASAADRSELLGPTSGDLGTNREGWSEADHEDDEGHSVSLGPVLVMGQPPLAWSC